MKICCKFASADRIQKPRSGDQRGGMHIKFRKNEQSFCKYKYEKRLSALILDCLEPGKFKDIVRNDATVDDLCGYVYSLH